MQHLLLNRNRRKKKKKKAKDYSKIFGEKLVKLARENEKIVAITASMKDGTGLREFPKRISKKFLMYWNCRTTCITI